MLTISTTVTTEQANLTQDVTITSTGALLIGSSAAPSSSYAASLQFNSSQTVILDGVIDTYLTTANLGILLGRISSGVATYHDGTITLGSTGKLSVTAKNSSGQTTATGVWGGNITFDAGIGSGNDITVSALSLSSVETSAGYANATGIYAASTIAINNTFAGDMIVTATAGVSDWSEAVADGLYALVSVNVADLSGKIDVTATGAKSGASGDATATGITAGSRDYRGIVTINGLDGRIEVEANGGSISGTLSGGVNGVAYGIYGSESVTITGFSGDIKVTGSGGSISQGVGFSYAQGRAFGIFSYYGDIDITGDGSRASITVTADGGNVAGLDGETNISDATAYAGGIFTHENVIANDVYLVIRVEAQGGTTTYNPWGKSFADSYGIYAKKNISLNGEVAITVSSRAGATGGWAYSGAIATGIYAGYQITNSVFEGDITVAAHGIEGRTDITADAYGIMAEEGIITSSMNVNISVGAYGSVSSGAPSMANAYGIYCKERTFGNGAQSIVLDGNISVVANGGSSDSNGLAVDPTAYAIYAGYINLELYGKLSATANGEMAYAIYIDNSGGYSDSLTLHAGSELAGIAELSGGANQVYIYQNTKGIENLRATDGTLHATLAFNDTISGAVMITAEQLALFNTVAYRVDTGAISSTYQVIGGTSKVAATYDVLYDGVTYTVYHDEWTTLGETNYAVKFSDELGNLQFAIMVNGNYLGAGITGSTSYTSAIEASFSGQTLGVVAGAGSAASGFGNLNSTVNLSVDSSNVTALYGGNSNGKGSININGDITLTGTNSTFGSIFGGGIGQTQAFRGGVNISLTDSIVTGAIYGAGSSRGENTSAKISINLNNTDVSGYIYGGSVSINTTLQGHIINGSTELIISNGSSISAQVYGGSRLTSSITTNSRIANGVYMDLSDSTFSNYVFGGGMAWAVNISSTTTVTSSVDNGVLINVSNVNSTHEIYGGGYAVANSGSYTVQGAVSVVNGGVSIVLADSSVVNVYGGGYNASNKSEVNGGTSITVNSSVDISGAIYGGGNGTGDMTVRANSIVNGGSYILVDLSNKMNETVSIGNIYAGGNTGTMVYGGATVEFTGDFFNNTLDISGVISGAGRNGAMVDGGSTLEFSNFWGGR